MKFYMLPALCLFFHSLHAMQRPALQRLLQEENPRQQEVHQELLQQSSTSILAILKNEVSAANPFATPSYHELSYERQKDVYFEAFYANTMVFTLGLFIACSAAFQEESHTSDATHKKYLGGGLMIYSGINAVQHLWAYYKS